MFDFLPPIWNGTLREHYLILFSAAGAIGVLGGLAGAWFGARFGTGRVVKEVLESLPGGIQRDETAYQLARVSQAVDAMSIEIERLSEGQRFAAKLLADRAASLHSPPPDRASGVITPH
jgi:hypothetical protein